MLIIVLRTGVMERRSYHPHLNTDVDWAESDLCISRRVRREADFLSHAFWFKFFRTSHDRLKQLHLMCYHESLKCQKLRFYCICFLWMYLPLNFRLSFINRKSRILYKKSSACWIGKYFHCFTDVTKVCIYVTLSTLSHDLHYRAVSFVVQISNQNMYTHFHCVEISTQELLKILQS
jgi:hypothetical protein